MANSMFILNDGMFHPHESTKILALAYFQKAPFKILLRGHGGEIAKASFVYLLKVPPGIQSCRSGNDILRCIYVKTNLVLQDSELSQLLSPTLYKQVQNGTMTSLRQSCEKVIDLLIPGDVDIYYYLKTTEKILLSSDLKNRGIYNLKALTEIFTVHISGQKNYGYLLGALAGLDSNYGIGILWIENFCCIIYGYSWIFMA